MQAEPLSKVKVCPEKVVRTFLNTKGLCLKLWVVEVLFVFRRGPGQTGMLRDREPGDFCQGLANLEELAPFRHYCRAGSVQGSLHGSSHFLGAHCMRDLTSVLETQRQEMCPLV